MTRGLGGPRVKARLAREGSRRGVLRAGRKKNVPGRGGFRPDPEKILRPPETTRCDQPETSSLTLRRSDGPPPIALNPLNLRGLLRPGLLRPGLLRPGSGQDCFGQECSGPGMHGCQERMAQDCIAHPQTSSPHVAPPRLPWPPCALACPGLPLSCPEPPWGCLGGFSVDCSALLEPLRARFCFLARAIEPLARGSAR